MYGLYRIYRKTFQSFCTKKPFNSTKTDSINDPKIYTNDIDIVDYISTKILNLQKWFSTHPMFLYSKRLKNDTSAVEYRKKPPVVQVAYTYSIFSNDRFSIANIFSAMRNMYVPYNLLLQDSRPRNHICPMRRENIFGECTENVFLSFFLFAFFILFVKNSKIFLSMGCEKKGNTHRYRTSICAQKIPIESNWRISTAIFFSPLICLRAFSRAYRIYLLGNILEKEAMNKLWKYVGLRITLFSSVKDWNIEISFA